MKLLVFGSTGGTGRQLIELALARGHAVSAFARNPAKLGMTHANLTVVTGDLADARSVQSAVPGHDAVLCAVGAPALARTTVRGDGTRQIIAAMESAGVRRLICQSSLGIGDSRAVRLPFHLRYFVIPVILRNGFADHERQEQAVRESTLDWTIVRPATMTNGSYTGSYRRGLTESAHGIKVKISRADVADFMLQQLEHDTYLHHAPWVSY